MKNFNFKTKTFSQLFFAGKLALIIFFLLALGLENSKAQGTWVQKADYGGFAKHGGVGFSIGSKGYMGTGSSNGVNSKDFWEYDPSSNIWTQKADFGGVARVYAAGFSIGSKGYIGTGGQAVDGSNRKKDFWEYDQLTNSWTPKADFGGTSRNGATGFSIDGKGYIGVGRDDANVVKDFWEYDPLTDAWTKKADFGGAARNYAAAFAMDGKGYIGTGLNEVSGYTHYNDFWEYDPFTDTWIQKANFGGSARHGAVGFSISSAGYIGTGYDGGYRKDFWEYSPSSNNWTQITDFGGIGRHVGVGFSIGSYGYVGTGTSPEVKDFWQLTPGVSACAIPTNLIVTNITATSAKLNWNAVPGAEAYKVRYKITGSSVWTKKSTPITNKTINSLSASTEYTWQVQTVCTSSPLITSSWSPSQTFTTAAARNENILAEKISLQIYPNPSFGKINIEMNLPIGIKSTTVRICNLQNENIYSDEFENVDGNLKKEISLNEISPGIYYVFIVLGDQVYSKKIEISR